jgi:hypothetical protein
MKISFDIENNTVLLDGIRYTNWMDIPYKVRDQIPCEFVFSILKFLSPVPDEALVEYAYNY